MDHLAWAKAVDIFFLSFLCVGVNGLVPTTGGRPCKRQNNFFLVYSIASRFKIRFLKEDSLGFGEMLHLKKCPAWTHNIITTFSISFLSRAYPLWRLRDEDKHCHRVTLPRNLAQGHTVHCCWAWNRYTIISWARKPDTKMTHTKKIPINKH